MQPCSPFGLDLRKLSRFVLRTKSAILLRPMLQALCEFMSTIKFLNIDLDIESDKDASLIVEEFGDRVSVMRNEFYEGKYNASFETPYSHENQIIEEYSALVNGLSPSAKELWNNCTKRVFDFGYESGEKPNGFHSNISNESIKKLAALNGSLVVTIYPPDPEDDT